MELRTLMCDITPKRPVMQGGYGTRLQPFSSVHDPIMAVLFALTIEGKTRYWIGADISNGTNACIEEIIKQAAKKGKVITRDCLIFGGSHTHSGPNIYVDKEPDKADPDYFVYACERIAEALVQIDELTGLTVRTRYSKVWIEGLYSNRNDKEKRCDKYVHILGFFNEKNLIALHVTLSHHCTILGPDNYELSADLFGALRQKLMQLYEVPVLMAQGNAADMGNRQYRCASGFCALDQQANALCQQIQEKLSWMDIDMEGYEVHRYTHITEYTLDASIYDEKIRLAEENMKTAQTVDERKLLYSALRGYRRKQTLGSGVHKVEMPVEIIDMKELQLIVVPGELGAVLGMEIKACSKAKACIIWGYANGAHLGYLVENAAYDEDSFESRISIYPKGVGDAYAAFIKEHL